MADDLQALLRSADGDPGRPDYQDIRARAHRQRVARLAALTGVALVGVAVAAAAMGQVTSERIPVVGNPETEAEPVEEFELDRIPEGVSATVVDDLRVFFLRSDDDVEVVLATAQHLPNEGLWWCPSEGAFASPAHGELFDRQGEAQFGPAERDLDRLHAREQHGTLLVEPNTVIPGEPAEVSETLTDVLDPSQVAAYEQGWDDEFCDDHRPDTDPPTLLATETPAPPPANAQPVDPEDVPQQLRRAFALDETDKMHAIPAGENQAVYATPQTDPPLLLATSCDLLTSTPRPKGWLGYCLKTTLDGQRVSGMFSYGTTSATSR